MDQISTSLIPAWRRGGYAVDRAKEPTTDKVKHAADHGCHCRSMGGAGVRSLNAASGAVSVNRSARGPSRKQQAYPPRINRSSIGSDRAASPTPATLTTCDRQRDGPCLRVAGRRRFPQVWVIRADGRPAAAASS
jgi:hypothetical protein